MAKTLKAARRVAVNPDEPDHNPGPGARIMATILIAYRRQRSRFRYLSASLRRGFFRLASALLHINQIETSAR